MLATECVCADVNETDSPPVSAAIEKIVKVELGHLRRGTKMVKELKISNPFESVFDLKKVQSSCKCTAGEVNCKKYKDSQAIPFTAKIHAANSGEFKQNLVLLGYVDEKPAALVINFSGFVSADLEVEKPGQAWVIDADRDPKESKLELRIRGFWGADADAKPEVKVSSPDVHVAVEPAHNLIKYADAEWKLILTPSDEYIDKKPNQLRITVEHAGRDGHGREASQFVWISLRRKLNVSPRSVLVSTGQFVSDIRYYFSVTNRPPYQETEGKLEIQVFLREESKTVPVEASFESLSESGWAQRVTIRGEDLIRSLEKTSSRLLVFRLPALNREETVRVVIPKK
tara:strand:+ start:1262 stop:2290 length:1029 start_codon:yes stop_codon:yes gene_type:complete